MPLETASTINQLNPSWPLAGDNESQGADHLRLVKSTLQITFPNVTGAVTPSQGDLNAVTGKSGGLGALSNTQLTDLATLSAAQIVALATITAAQFTQASGGGIVPSGVICLWYGTKAAIPSGWFVCDGNNGTPNLGNVLPIGMTSGTPGVTQAGTVLSTTGAGVTVSVNSVYFIMKS